MKNFLNHFFEKEWTIYEKVLWTGFIAATGILVGFLLSPVKSGSLIKNSVLSNNVARECGNGNTAKDNAGKGNDCCKKNSKLEKKSKLLKEK